jgi:hypothetical protein
VIGLGQGGKAEDDEANRECSFDGHDCDYEQKYYFDIISIID